MQAHFVLPSEAASIAELEQLDPDRDWQEFVTTTRAWILQTYLRLHAAGCPVTLRDTLPSDGIAVISTGDYRALLRHRSTRTGALIVATRGSYHRTPPFADFEIVQNTAQADDKRRFFMTHWPQPALVRRDPARGTLIKRIAYKGFLGNLRAEFREPRWLEFLASQGIEWVEHASDYADAQTDTSKLQWPNYHDIDLLLAVRDEDPAMYPGRPATKLYNAWLAGVPALLGPELAYRSERQHPDDYIEVRNIEEAQAAVLTLLTNPDRYRGLLARAQQRALDYSVAATTRRWQELLFDRFAPHVTARKTKNWSRSLAMRQWVGRVTWTFATRISRKRRHPGTHDSGIHDSGIHADQ